MPDEIGGAGEAVGAPGGAGRRIALHLGVALVSAVALATQVAFTRILSIALWHHFAYLVVGIALLGYAVAGAWLATRGRRASGEDQTDGDAALLSLLSRRARLLALATLVSVTGAAVIRCNTLDLFRDPAVAVALVALVALCALPFFGAGIVVATALAARSGRSGSVWAADLAGAAAGAALALPGIGALGAPGVVFAAAVVAALAAAVFASGAGRSALIRSGGLALALGGVMLAVPLTRVWIYPAPSKELRLYYNPEVGLRNVELTRWTAYGRIDVSTVTRLPPMMGGNFGPGAVEPREVRVVTQDGAAPTLLCRTTPGELLPFVRHASTAAVWRLRAARPAPSGKTEALVIGVGGGVDIHVALAHGATRVTGVELNPATLSLLRQRYAEFTGRLAERSELQLINAEGRSYLRRTGRRFDVIQLSGVDTFAALSHGAHSVAEAYVYTLEAFEDYLAHLRPSGCLQVSRLILEPPRETLRLAVTAAEAIVRRGDPHPFRRIAILRGKEWASLIVCRAPIRRAEASALAAFARAEGFSLVYEPHHRGRSAFHGVLQVDAQRRAQFIADYGYRIEPATDDTPFFFNYFRWRSLGSLPRLAEGHVYAPAVPIGHAVVLATLVITSLLAVGGILVPLRRLPRAADLPRGRVTLYFAGLGLAYLLVEIGLLQRLTFFLGSPTHALSVVLALLLLASGAGAAVVRRLGPRLSRALPLLLPLSLLATLMALRALDGALGLSTGSRVALAAALIAPAGFLMGMPFVLGIDRLHRHAASYVPWAFGINALFTVIASALSTLVALELGFSSLLVLAAGIYLATLLLFRR